MVVVLICSRTHLKPDTREKENIMIMMTAMIAIQIFMIFFAELFSDLVVPMEFDLKFVSFFILNGF